MGGGGVRLDQRTGQKSIYTVWPSVRKKSVGHKYNNLYLLILLIINLHIAHILMISTISGIPPCKPYSIFWKIGQNISHAVFTL